MPMLAPEAIAAPSAEWAKAIGLTPSPGTRSMISRSWRWLEDRGLVRTELRGKVLLVRPNNEDGTRREWSHPAENNEPYFRLPHAYWDGGFAFDLSLAAKAMLLIALSIQERPEESGPITTYFEFPIERGAAWYGLSKESARSGLRELRDIGLMRTWVEKRATIRSPVGVTYDRRHSLNRLDEVAYRRNLR
jgi:hypothetical protein